MQRSLSQESYEIIDALGRCMAWLDTESRVTMSDTKEDATDLVTNVDREMEQKLIAALAQIRPGANIVAEESQASTHPDWSAETWLIDPIDGTTNFFHGSDAYTVNIALWDGADLRIGAIGRPSDKTIAIAERGRGAWLEGRPLKVSDTGRLDEALLTTGLDYAMLTDAPRKHRFERLVKSAQGVRRTGAAGIDLLGVASGTFDGYFEEDSNSWDWAAGCLLVEEAGGKVSCLEGARWQPADRSIIASNAVLHDVILHALSQQNDADKEAQ